jgi:hypothetical protein
VHAANASADRRHDGGPCGDRPGDHRLRPCACELFSWCRPVVYGDAAILGGRRTRWGSPFRSWGRTIRAPGDRAGRAVAPAAGGVAVRQAVAPGFLAMADTSAPRRATSWREGDAIVTCPVTKEGLKGGGRPLSGAHGVPGPPLRGRGCGDDARGRPAPGGPRDDPRFP